MTTMRRLAVIGSLMIGALSPQVGYADEAVQLDDTERLNYQCRVFSNTMPPTGPEIFAWDGSTPFQRAISAMGASGFMRVQNLGVAGRPEYIFEVRIADRTLLSVSQKSGLTDYILDWRTDTPGSNKQVTITCTYQAG